MKKYQSFLSENFQFLEMKFSIYLNRHVFVMGFSTSLRLKPLSLSGLIQLMPALVAQLDARPIGD